MALKGIVPHSESLFGNTTQVRKELTAARQLVKSCKKAIPQDQELGRDLGEVWSLPAARYYHCMTITEMCSSVWLDVRGIRTQVS